MYVATVVESPIHGQYQLFRWLDFYLPKLKQLNVNTICAINNGSKNLPIDSFIDKYHIDSIPPKLNDEKLNFIYYPERLARTALWSYPGLWRSIITMVKLAKHYQYDKFIYFEWDTFILSDKMLNDIASIKEGFVTYFSDMYRMPDACIMICCKDQYDNILNKVEGVDFSNNTDVNKTTELFLPWTEVRRTMTGDRYTELNTPDKLDRIVMPKELDYVCQVYNNTKLIKLGDEHKFTTIEQELQKLNA